KMARGPYQELTMADTEVARLADLLRDAAAAHHRAFTATDGVDPEWATWYAEYLAPRLAASRHVDVASLADQLIRLDAEHRTTGAAEPWPEYYAARLRVNPGSDA